MFLTTGAWEWSWAWPVASASLPAYRATWDPHFLTINGSSFHVYLSSLNTSVIFRSGVYEVSWLMFCFLLGHQGSCDTRAGGEVACGNHRHTGVDTKHPLSSTKDWKEGSWGESEKVAVSCVLRAVLPMRIRVCVMSLRSRLVTSRHDLGRLLAQRITLLSDLAHFKTSLSFLKWVCENMSLIMMYSYMHVALHT